jgi:uncharacterized membrane protein YphA (DoxX/SURF4 family)
MIPSDIGRVFYAVAIAAMGLETIYYRDFPYMLIPPAHVWAAGHIPVVYLCGALLFLAGGCIALDKAARPVSFLLGAALLLVFCFDFIPYQFGSSSRYMHFANWENAAKELTLAGGAIVIAGRYRFGVILFALTILNYGVLHLLYAKEAGDYIPSWVSNHLIWMYVTGAALIGSSLAILLGIRRRLFAALLGIMILIWVIILHIPKATGAPLANNEGEVTSAFLALSYCGIAFVIAGGDVRRSLSPARA